MKPSDVLFAILYGSAFFLVLYFIIGMFNKPDTIVIQEETPVVYYDTVWPWYGGYNYWPTWFPWGGGYGGYGGGRWRNIHTRPGRWHGGSHRPWGGGGRGAHAGGFGRFGAGARGGAAGGGARGGGGGGRGGGGGGGRGGGRR